MSCVKGVLLFLILIMLASSVFAEEATFDRYSLIIDKTIADQEFFAPFVDSFKAAMNQLLGWNSLVEASSLTVTLSNLEIIHDTTFMCSVDFEYKARSVTSAIVIVDTPEKHWQQAIVEQLQYDILSLVETEDPSQEIQYVDGGTMSSVVPNGRYHTGQLIAIENNERQMIAQAVISSIYSLQNEMDDAIEMHPVWTNRVLLPSMKLGKTLSPWRWSLAVPVSLGTIGIEGVFSRATTVYPLRINGAVSFSVPYTMDSCHITGAAGLQVNLPFSFFFDKNEGFFANSSIDISALAVIGVAIDAVNNAQLIYGSRGSLSFINQFAPIMYWNLTACYNYLVSATAGTYTVYQAHLDGIAIAAGIGFIW